MSLAFAHAVAEGVVPAPGAGLSLLLDWTFDPTFLVPLALALLYLRGLRTQRRRGGRLLPRWRGVCFGAGLAFTALALLSPVDALADSSFTWHMAQHMLLTMSAVPLLLLGAPFLPVVRGLPAGFRRAVFIPLARNRAVRWLCITITRPVPGLLLYMTALWAWHDPTLYDLALEHQGIHYLEHFSFAMGAALMWWNVTSPYPFRPRMVPLLQMGYLFFGMIQSSALGALLTFSETVWYDYDRLAGFWGLTMAEDQLLGGLMMWVGGAMMHLVAITAIFVVYAIQEEKKEPRPLRLEGERRVQLA